jgi:voltage-gated potassium channel
VIVFTIEYALRLWSAVEIPILSRMRPWHARAIFASRPIMIIDLLAFAPWYVQWLIPVDLRVVRLLRVLRLFKLARFSPV